MIDKELITRKIVLISQDLDEILSVSKSSETEFLENKISQTLTERYLERIITRMIDINYHLLVESGKPPPPDYFQSFLQLAELGIYSAEFAKKIALAAGLRNRLVHEYNGIDYAILHKSVKEAAADIPQYLKSIEEFLVNQ